MLLPPILIHESFLVFHGHESRFQTLLIKTLDFATLIGYVTVFQPSLDNCFEHRNRVIRINFSQGNLYIFVRVKRVRI